MPDHQYPTDIDPATVDAVFDKLRAEGYRAVTAEDRAILIGFHRGEMARWDEKKDKEEKKKGEYK